MFKHILSKITDRSDLEPLTHEAIEEIRRECPHAPKAYFAFLREVGWGDIGDMMIYSGLVPSEEFHADISPLGSEIMVFGDNWQFSQFGFDMKNNGRLVEITPEGEVEPIDDDFATFIAGYAC